MTNPRPINCSADEARRILAGTVTQLRRYDDHWFNRAMPGDLFWLREPHRFLDKHDEQAPSTIEKLSPAGPCVHFDADGPQIEPFGKSRPARVLLRTLSRAVLKITRVKTAPLQDWAICDYETLGLNRIRFAADWDANRDKVNSFRGGQASAFWSENPIVRVINFTLIRTNINKMKINSTKEKPAPEDNSGAGKIQFKETGS